MPFSHDIAGGQGSLIAASLKSPNFVHGSTGWSIGKDGSAEFHDIILPDGEGVSVFFASSPPVTTHTGDLWYNTANGLQLSQWNGSSWVAYQIGTGAIGSGAITNTQLAGTVTARSIGGITTTISAVAPGSHNTGDLWINSASGYQLNQWNGSAWVALSWTATNVLSAATITGALIAASTIVGGNIAAATITASNIAAATITAAQIAANTIVGSNIEAGTISGLNPAASFHGLNMITDPQFSSTALNAVRLADPATSAGWTLSGGTAVHAASAPASRLPLMPSTGESMWVNPGEQYYLSITATTTASMQVGIEIHTNAGLVGVNQTFSGTQTVSGVVTIPAGATQAYVDVYVFGSGATATLSNPVCQPATLNAPSINGGTITGGTFVGTNWIENSHGSFLYSGTPAAGNLIASVAPASGNDAAWTSGSGNNYPAGLMVAGTSGGSVTIDPTANSGIPYVAFTPKGATHINIPPEVYAGGLNLGLANEVETLYATSGQSQATANTNSALQLFSDAADGSTKAYANFVIDGVNTTLRNLLGGYLPVTQTSTATLTNANAGAQFMAGWTIPANDAQVGTVYEVDVPFNGTFENQSLGFKPYIGATAVTTSGGDTIGASFFTTGTAFQGTVRMKMQILTTGSSGTVNFFIDGGIGVNGGRSSGTNNNNAYLSSQATAVTLNTTVANTISIASVWGGSTAGQTITSRGSKLTRTGP